ncbi:cation:proton antiporter [Alkalibacterium olivapovliticus]|uniref:Kef-type K+ transport system membrane component KefB n=1 Tax=Alkalibacterium olivapovliticus TaxID=99907 RepID=A0A2T0VY59_9LACT|nr:cation:proton antiporter [Alkalibacterium olivapovliticus]PRY77139.1 Kef-type K+ transport system membrane component KefB [Alkalibacterium olivapovliticus]
MTYSLYIAILMLVGIAGGKLASKLGLPTVTGYLLCGLLLGPSVLNLITSEVYYSLGFVNELALGMLALSIGTELHYLMFRKFGKNLVTISLGSAVLTVSVVTLLTWLTGMPLQYALVLGTLALTVSPAGVVEVVKDTRSEGEMTQNVLGLVAFDNLVAIMAFGMMISFVQSLGDQGAGGFALIATVILDIVYGLIVGLVSGLFVSYFIRKDTSSDKLLVFLIAAILFNTGIASMFGLSPVLINIFSGIAITNLTSRKVLVASLLNRIELPIFVVFLTLAGAHIDISIIGTVGLAGFAYIIARSIGKYAGSLIFSQFTNVNKKIRPYLGLGLFPQAGIAIGLATIAERSLPNVSGAIIGVILTGAVFFEIVGPMITGYALKAVDETKKERPKQTLPKQKK